MNSTTLNNKSQINNFYSINSHIKSNALLSNNYFYLISQTMILLIIWANCSSSSLMSMISSSSWSFFGENIQKANPSYARHGLLIESLVLCILLLLKLFFTEFVIRNRLLLSITDGKSERKFYLLLSHISS